MENKEKKHVSVIILAAGRGTRMSNNKHLPKALVPLGGKPLIKWLIDSVIESRVTDFPALVIGHFGEQIIEELGCEYPYYWQKEQLGTGHAVTCARDHFKEAKEVVVLYSDQPLVKATTIQKIVDTHRAQGNTLTFATLVLPHFEGKNALFYDFGRIIRDDEGNLLGNIEKGEATPETLEVTEVNCGVLCFNAKWLDENLSKISMSEVKKEYYLPELITLAIQNGQKVGTVYLDSLSEALGANTVEQLDEMESLLSKLS